MNDETRTNADKVRTNAAFLHSELTDRIIGAFYKVYDSLGFGFLESVCKNALAKVLRDMGIAFEREVPIDVYFEGEPVGHFKADFLVDGKVILEVKASQAAGDADTKQLLNYLRATRAEVGLLLHFGPKPMVQRRVFENQRKLQQRNADQR